MGKTVLILIMKPKENILANLLTNMLTLQTDHHIPMRMDISTKDLIEYYKSQVTDFDSIDKARLLQSVIADLQEKLNPAI